MYNNEFPKSVRRKATKAFSSVFGAIAGYSLISLSLVYIVQIATAIILGGDALIALSENPLYLWGVQIFSMYLVAFPLFLLFIRKLPSASREKGEMSLKEFGYIFLVSEAVMLLGSIVSNWLTSVFEGLIGHEIPNTTSDLIEKTPISIIILVVVVIGPIVEEMIFRKVMIDKLSIYGDRLAVIVSAIAFGIFHGNFYQLFYATALGLVLGYAYTKTRKSIYNCLLHMAVNFMGTIPAMLIQDSLERLQALPEDAMIEGSLINDYYLVMGVSTIQYILACAGVWVFISATKNRAYHVSNSCDEKLSLSDYPRVCLFNLGVIAFLIVGIGQCVLSLFLV
jgi:membrane protease YdiL (CAAX protease family)